MHHRSSHHRRRRVAAFLVAGALALIASLVPLPSASAQGAGTFVFTGAGWGHGVGMSQQGARNMADEGYDHVGILAHYYPNTVVSPVPTLDKIRVHIGDASRVELASSGSITFERGGVAINAIPSGSIQIAAHDGGLQIGNAWTTATRSDPVFVSYPMPVRISNNGHSYLWGKLQLTNRDGKVRVVEVLPLEDYVAGISEMPAAWPLEALMAQAIAARTYAHEVSLHRRNSEEWDQEYDISGTTIDQNYIGWDAQDGQWDQKWTAVVKATAGVEIVDGKGPIRAYYSASNGGYTETAAYVFNNDVPYTMAGPDPFDAGGHNWTEWSRVYTQEAMSRWLNQSDDTRIGTLIALNVLGGAGASSRLDRATVELVGSEATRRVTGKRLMVVLNAGIFGEGGGLDLHLPGTFTTIGNGVNAGPPQPTGQAVAPVATPDPLIEARAATVGFTPPPGWRPEPGTGVAPVRGSGAAPTSDTETADEDDAPARIGETYLPPEGWTPEPGTGVPPVKATGAIEDAGDDRDEPGAPGTSQSPPSPEGSYTPPPGWQPEPGTGVPPIRGAGPTAGAGNAESIAADDSEATEEEPPVPSGYTPPAGWQPEPGTGVAPVPAAASADPVGADTTTVGGTGGRYTPPPGWKPTPGTGVAPNPIPAS